VHLEVGSDVGRVGSNLKGLITNAPVWGRGERLLLTCIPRPSLTRCVWKEGRIVLINNLIDPLKDLSCQ